MQQKFKERIGYIVNFSTIGFYFVLLIVLEIPPPLEFLQYAGLVLFAAGLLLIVLSIVALNKNQSKDTLINSGVYSLVRHPMYLGAIFVYSSMAFFLPHWIMVILAVVNVLYIYWFMVIGEQQNIEKFGDDYVSYMQSVPRANLIAGFLRRFRERG